VGWCHEVLARGNGVNLWGSRGWPKWVGFVCFVFLYFIAGFTALSAGGEN